MNPEEKVEYLLGLRPEGGTFWSRSKKTVRYLRVFRFPPIPYLPPDGRTVIAVLTELAGGSEIHAKVTLYVETPRGKRAAEFTNPKPTMEFMQSLFDDPAFHLINDSLLPEIQTFLFTPDRTVLTTW